MEIIAMYDFSKSTIFFIGIFPKEKEWKDVAVGQDWICTVWGGLLQ